MQEPSSEETERLRDDGCEPVIQVIPFDCFKSGNINDEMVKRSTKTRRMTHLKTIFRFGFLTFDHDVAYSKNADDKAVDTLATALLSYTMEKQLDATSIE
jgi:hypothetical protein